MRLRLVASLLFGLGAVPSLAHAQEPAPPAAPAAAPFRTMTLDEALAFARAHQLRAASARERVAAAEKDVDVAGAQWLPRVGAMAQVVGSTANNSTATILGTPTVDLPRVGATKVTTDYDLQPYPTTAAALGVRQQLYDFGRVQAERAASEAALAVERARAAGTTLEVEYAVRQAYYGVLAADAIAQASAAAYERAAQHRDLANANVRSGLRPPIEATRAEADVARYEAAMMRARMNIRIARVSFAATIGAEDEEIGAAPAAPDTGALPPISSLVSRAGKTPLVLEGRARLEAQRAETRRLEAQNRPTVWATASVSGRAGGATPSSGPVPTGDGWIPTVPNYNGGVVFSWPIFDATWNRRAEASRARETVASTEADLASQTQIALIRTTYDDAAVSRETLAAAERGVQAARANWDQAEHRFAVGLGTSTELADAQALRTDAEIQLAIAMFNTARSRAALERAVAVFSTTEGR